MAGKNCLLDLGNEIAYKRVWHDTEFGDTLVDLQEFAPQSEIWVEKNIRLIAHDETTVELIQFAQYFSQEGAAIPELGTPALFALGLLGFALARRRQYQRSV